MKRLLIYHSLFLLLFSAFTYAQIPEPSKPPEDTTTVGVIPLEKIPIASVETSARLDEIAKTIITKQQIESEGSRNDSLLMLIDSLLSIEDSLSFDSLPPRIIINKRIFWDDYLDIMAEQNDRITSIIKNLSAIRKEINKDAALWTSTRKSIDPLYADTLILNSIDGLVDQADSIRNLIVSRTNETFAIIKKIAIYELRIENLLERFNTSIRQSKEKAFIQTQPSITQLDLSELQDFDLKQTIRFYINKSSLILNYFYQKQANTIFIYLIYLLSLIVLCVVLMNKSKRFIERSNTYYQDLCIKILRRPLSVAIIIGIFSSGLFLKSQPPIFIDLSILVLTAAIVDLFIHISNRKFHKYLFVFAVLILLRFIDYIFPPTIYIHRIILFIIGVVEIIFLVQFNRHLKASPLKSQTLNSFVKAIILFHLAASIIGAAASIIGYVKLAEIANYLPITNTLVGLLLIISTIVLVGSIQLAIDGKALSTFHYIRNRRELLKKRVAQYIAIIAGLFWLNYILQILRVDEIFYDATKSMFTDVISIGAASFTIWGVLMFFFIIFLSITISNFLQALLEDDLLDKFTLKKGVPRMITAVLRFSLISLGFFLAVSTMGIPLNQLTIIFGAFSVGIGFGLQNIVNNFISGIILLFERPIQIGDTVEVGNLVGTVSYMGIRSSHVKTFDGAEVVVPNANLISNEVVNWTLTDKKRRIEIFSGVAYGSDIYKVKQILEGVLQSHPDILKDPTPMVLFNDLGESSLDFRLLCWTQDFDNWVIIKSELIFKVHDALYEAGIEIPFPQRDLHIKSSNIKTNHD